jgi:hypothetical protein
MFERLIYVSEAAPGVGARDAYDIIRIAHNRNSQAGLTGALVFIDGHFVQVLEGDSFHLRQRFARIAADPRHVNVQLREWVAIVDRMFPRDWMALRQGEGVALEVQRSFGYKPGFPPGTFPPQRLAAFVRACCDASPPAG